MSDVCSQPGCVLAMHVNIDEKHVDTLKKYVVLKFELKYPTKINNKFQQFYELYTEEVRVHYYRPVQNLRSWTYWSFNDKFRGNWRLNLEFRSQSSRHRHEKIKEIRSSFFHVVWMQTAQQMTNTYVSLAEERLDKGVLFIAVLKSDVNVQLMYFQKHKCTPLLAKIGRSNQVIDGEFNSFVDQ